MLKSLTIKNFILLKHASLDFTNGFNVLCGETGAGKSIIIKALDSVLGAKINKDVILDKNQPCYIEATFENDGVETVISREISASSKFRLNGIMSSLDEIKDGNSRSLRFMLSIDFLRKTIWELPDKIEEKIDLRTLDDALYFVYSEIEKNTETEKNT